MRARGLGHKADKPGVHPYPVGSTPTGSLDLSKGCIVRDQSFTSACVGFALAAAAEISVGHAVRFSPICAYTMARMFGRDDWRTPLTDDGSYPLLATQALAKHGFVSDRYTFSVNEDLPFDCMEEGVTHKLSAYYRIPTPGCFEGIRRSLASGNAVTLAVTCDGSFEYSNGRSPIPSPVGQTRGSHYVVCVGYAPEGIRILNSWGKDWGDEGYGWLSPERCEHPTTCDVQVIDVVEL